MATQVQEPESGLLTTTEAAALLGVERGTLEVWRATKRYGLPYIKVGRLVKYRKTDVQEFIDRRRVPA